MDEPDHPVTSKDYDKPLGVEDPNQPGPEPAGVAPAPAPVPADPHPQAPDATAKVLDDPADANHGDVASALAVDPYRAPAPFSKRDGLPDITSESVAIRLLEDYRPADTGRYGPGLRGRKGDLLAFPPDEALELIRSGVGEREVDDKTLDEQHQADDLKREPPR